MPIYEYVCDSCGHDFERQQSFHDAPVSTCPVCGKVSVRRLISSVGVVFKGSGWYVNDSKRKSTGDKGGVSDAKASETAATADSGDGAGASADAPAKAGETTSAAGGGKAAEASSGSASSDAGETKSKSAKGKSGDSAAGAGPATPDKSK